MRERENNLRALRHFFFLVWESCRIFSPLSCDEEACETLNKTKTTVLLVA